MEFPRGQERRAGEPVLNGGSMHAQAAEQVSLINNL